MKNKEKITNTSSENIIKCFHRTTFENADQILRNGFKDNPQTNGIWISEGEPYGANDGANGDIVLAGNLKQRRKLLAELPVCIIDAFPAIANLQPVKCGDSVNNNEPNMFIDHLSQLI